VTTPQAESARTIYDVFLSHNGADKPHVEALAGRLEDEAGLKPFLDKWHLVPGEPWQEALEEALDQSRTCAVFLGPSGLGPWENEEMRVALRKRVGKKSFRVIPVLLPGAQPKENESLPSFLVGLTWVDFRKGLDDEEQFQRLIAGIRGNPPGRLSLSPSTARPLTNLPAPLQTLLDAVLDSAKELALSEEQVEAIKAHRPADLREYRLCRIAEWSQSQYTLDKRFVNLSMIIDKGAHEWHRLPADEFRFNDLRHVLEKRKEDKALVLLGAPGSGKSTLLRRLQLDHSADCLREENRQVSFFLSLNRYAEDKTGHRPAPFEWLAREWNRQHPELAANHKLEDLLRDGRALLLLDALNEMPHRGADDYGELIEQWQAFVMEAAGRGNRILFSCRKLDYSARLSTDELPVPQIEVQPMNAEQMREFLQAYSPKHQERIWRELDGSPQFGFFQTPYFLKMLCELAARLQGDLPKGRAGLFTGFVRQALERECVKKDALFKAGSLLDERDHNKLLLREWAHPFDLPERGVLIRSLGNLAYRMQEKQRSNENSQVRIKYDDAVALLDHPNAKDILKAGTALNVLDDDRATDDILFFHQLLQEYFAARRLAKEPKPDLVHVEWSADQADPPLQQVLAELADGDPLPNLPQTGWEETTLSAVPMAKDPEAYMRMLMAHNLPLAARCAASGEAPVSQALKREIQHALIARTRDQQADLRARIAAGEALGIIGDPRFVLKAGKHGEFLLPPLVEIPAGTYPIGDNKSEYSFEKPACKVKLASFQIGQFLVTNAEYKCFMDAKGYEDEQWWDSEESKAWLQGKLSMEGIKQQLRSYRKTVQGWGEEGILDRVRQNRWTTETAENWIERCNMSDEEYEELLEEWFPEGTTYRQPDFWDDTRFNSPAQPVVGVTWFEARAYCNWLTATSGTNERIFRLPTEVEFEAAARGGKGRAFPYGKKFESSRCNTFESHIRRTTPVGIFDNATPEGAYDLSGNVYSWTLSIYDQQRFPYPYKPNDGREDIHLADINRVLRGGSWSGDHIAARAVYRDDLHPASRSDVIGFRVVCSVRPPSLLNR
jgi:formylglycine-generating enzyme required for sulfatase activity